MNWLLLLLIIELFANNLAAPIDLLETIKGIHADQNVFNNLTKNENVTFASEANHLNNTWPTMLNRTENVLNISSLNENFNKNVVKVATDYGTVRQLEVQKKLKNNSGKKQGDEIPELSTVTIKGEPFFEQVDVRNLITAITVDNSEDHLDGLQHKANSTKEKDIFSTNSMMSGGLKALVNETLPSTQELDVKNISEIFQNEAVLESKIEAEHSTIPYAINIESVSQVPNIYSHLTQQPEKEAFASNFSIFVLEKPQEDHQDPTIVGSSETSSRDYFSINKREEATASTLSTKEVVDNFNWVDKLNDGFSPVSNNKNEERRMKTSTTTDEELLSNFSVTQSVTENFNNPGTPIILNRNISATEFPTDLNFEEGSVQSHTFAQAVDTFIKNTLETGVKVSQSIPEKIQDEQLPKRIEIFGANVNGEPITVSEINIEERSDAPVEKLNEIVGNINKDDTAVIVNGTVVTTLPFWGNLKQNHHHNKKEKDESTEGFNISSSLGSLIREASISSGKDFSETLLKSENKSQTISENTNKNLIDRFSNEEKTTLPSNSHDFEVSSLPSPYKNVIEATTTPLVKAQNDVEENSSISTKTQLGNFQTSQDIEKIEENTADGQEDAHQQKQAEFESNQVLDTTKITEYIQIIKPNNNESEIESTSSRAQQLGPAAPLDSTHTNAPSQDDDLVSQVLSGEKGNVQIKEQSFSRNTKNEIYESTAINEIPKTEDYTSSLQQLHQNYNNEFNKFENNLKTLSEKDEYTQRPESINSTLNPLISTTSTRTGESSTLPDLEETTILPGKSKEKPIIEKSTHGYFEEFDNNLKHTTNKIMLWETEYGIPDKIATFQSILDGITMEAVPELATTQKYLSEQSTAIKSLNESATTVNYVLGKIHHKTEIDEDEEMIQDKVENSQINKQLKQLKLQENADTLDKTFTTPLPTIEATAALKVDQVQFSEDTTTIQNDVKEYRTAPTTDYRATGVETTTNENIIDTTTVPVDTLPLQMIVNTNFLTIAVEPFTEVATENVNKTQRELSGEPIKENITLPPTEINQQENNEYEDPSNTSHKNGSIAGEYSKKEQQTTELTTERGDILLKASVISEQHSSTMTYNEQLQDSLMTELTTKGYEELLKSADTNEQRSLITSRDDQTEHSFIKEPQKIESTTKPDKLSKSAASTTTHHEQTTNSFVAEHKIQHQQQIEFTTERNDELSKESATNPIATHVEQSGHSLITEQQQQQQQQQQIELTTRRDTELLKSAVTSKQRSSTKTHNEHAQHSFMHEHKGKQFESTTEHDDEQSQLAVATLHKENSELQTMVAKIYSTTTEVVEENLTTVASVESDARSLSLPPPKLEHLQNEDGVEVFYGYSIVKHN